MEETLRGNPLLHAGQEHPHEMVGAMAISDAGTARIPAVASIAGEAYAGPAAAPSARHAIPVRARHRLDTTAARAEEVQMSVSTGASLSVRSLSKSFGAPAKALSSVDLEIGAGRDGRAHRRLGFGQVDDAAAHLGIPRGRSRFRGSQGRRAGDAGGAAGSRPTSAACAPTSASSSSSSTSSGACR